MTKCDFNKFSVSVIDVFGEPAFMSLSKTSKDIFHTIKMLLRSLIKLSKPYWGSVYTFCDFIIW